jgi:hypothetical protein
MRACACARDNTKSFAKKMLKFKSGLIHESTSWGLPQKEAAIGRFNLKESLTFQLIQPINFILTFMISKINY